MNNLICHIIGISQNMKKNFYDRIGEELSNIHIIDLDELSLVIINDDTMNKLYNKYSYYSKRSSENNSQNQSDNTTKYKNIEKKMETYWKNKMEWLLGKQVENNIDKFIIIIGRNTYYRNSKIYLKLECCKFVVKVDLLENAKQIIKYNLETYKEDIINGIYNLKYLETNFIIKNRKDLQKSYKKKGYILKDLDNIIKLLKVNITNFDNFERIDKLYIGSTKKFDKKILPNDDNELVAYSIPWLAITSIFNNKYFKRGFDNDKPYIQEKIENGLDILNYGCYLYTVNKDNFIYHDRGEPYKLFRQSSIKYIEKKLIPNIIDFLYNDDINIINLKQ